MRLHFRKHCFTFIVASKFGVVAMLLNSTLVFATSTEPTKIEKVDLLYDLVGFLDELFRSELYREREVELRRQIELFNLGRQDFTALNRLNREFQETFDGQFQGFAERYMTIYPWRNNAVASDIDVSSVARLTRDAVVLPILRWRRYDIGFQDPFKVRIPYNEFREDILINLQALAMDAYKSLIDAYATDIPPDDQANRYQLSFRKLTLVFVWIFPKEIAGNDKNELPRLGDNIRLSDDTFLRRMLDIGGSRRDFLKRARQEIVYAKLMFPIVGCSTNF